MMMIILIQFFICFCWPLLSPLHRRGWLRALSDKRRLGLGVQADRRKDTGRAVARCRLVSSEGLDRQVAQQRNAKDSGADVVEEEGGKRGEALKLLREVESRAEDAPGLSRKFRKCGQLASQTKGCKRL